MIAGSTERVKSRRFRTVRVVVSSLSTVARSMGRSPLHHAQARAGLVVDIAQGVWQHSTRNREGTQSRGETAMEIGPLTLESHPKQEDVQFLEDRLHEYNDAQTGITDGQLLALFIRAAQHTIQAGLAGWTWGGCCYIRYLWVHADLRGQGYGTRLMQAAEQEAAARGCHQVLLDTHSFQAPAFYQHLGYEVFAVLDEYPRHHQNYYLRKRLP